MWRPLVSARLWLLRRWAFMLWGASLWLVTCSVPVAASDDGLLTSGMLLDKTISRQGKQFSDIYSAYWRELPGTTGLTVVVQEQIYPQAGTLLTVQLGTRRIYQTYLGRRLQEIKPLAEQAVLQTVPELARQQAEMMLGADAWLSVELDGEL